MTRISFLSSCALLAGLLGACGASPDDASGAATMRLAGRVVKDQPVAPAAQVTMVWTYDSGAGDYVVGENVNVTGAFPASFTLDLTGQPAGFPSGNFAAFGFITALDQGATEVPDEDALLGIAEQHVVVYLSGDVADLPAPQHDDAVVALGGELTAGYHLMEVTPAVGTFDELTQVPSTTAITVRMAPADDLDIPNVF